MILYYYMNWIKVSLLIFAGVCMIGQGSRMIYEGIVADSYYRPNTFDMLFDWTTLSVAGILIFGWGVSVFYQKMKETEAKKKIPSYEGYD